MCGPLDSRRPVRGAPRRSVARWRYTAALRDCAGWWTVRLWRRGGALVRVSCPSPRQHVWPIGRERVGGRRPCAPVPPAKAVQQRPRGCLPPIMDETRVRFSFAPRRPPRYVWGRQAENRARKKEKNDEGGGYSDGVRCLGTGRHPPSRPAAPCRCVPPAPPAPLGGARASAVRPLRSGSAAPTSRRRPTFCPAMHTETRRHADAGGGARRRPAQGGEAAPSLPRPGPQPSIRVGRGPPGEPVGPRLPPPPATATTGGGAGAVAVASCQRGRGRGVPPPPHPVLSPSPSPRYHTVAKGDAARALLSGGPLCPARGCPARRGGPRRPSAGRSGPATLQSTLPGSAPSCSAPTSAPSPSTSLSSSAAPPPLSPPVFARSLYTPAPYTARSRRGVHTQTLVDRLDGGLARGLSSAAVGVA